MFTQSCSKSAAVWLAAVAVFAGIASTTTPLAQQAPAGAAAPAAPPARGRGPAPTDTLGAGPWDLVQGRGRIHVTAIKGLDHPWGIAFVPDGSMLVTERPGRLRVIRNGVVDPTPIGPLPQMLAVSLGGALDVTLDPQFTTNRRIYIAYAKPGPGGGNDATTAVYRARWDGGSTLTEGKDIWVADAYHGAPGTEKLPGVLGPATGSYGTRFAWDPAGNLFVSLGDRNIGVKAQDPNSHIGKIVRITTDGGVPKDNPFVGRAGYKPEIWTLGHRNPLGLYVSPIDGRLWETEEGPQGGDELNVIEKGKNYGWPEVSLGRNYDGTIVGKGFTAPGYEEPIVYWVPAIAISGLSIYNGDKFPNWKGSAFVGGMRNNTGQHIQRVWFNDKGLPIGREIMLADLKQRIREIKPGPDGYLYALTDETFGAVLQIEPPS
ncbi:MAG TPA: PQQ-dependent sugar dehydrogenase [Vicinamibacterales bacterium]|jgi:glucose/arabinose dehydrogenase|nr:PQQ-dependent sugar dehydrogenase [Vicinamibacterales bacterium]